MHIVASSVIASVATEASSVDFRTLDPRSTDSIARCFESGQAVSGSILWQRFGRHAQAAESEAQGGGQSSAETGSHRATLQLGTRNSFRTRADISVSKSSGSDSSSGSSDRLPFHVLIVDVMSVRDSSLEIAALQALCRENNVIMVGMPGHGSPLQELALSSSDVVGVVSPPPRLARMRELLFKATLGRDSLLRASSTDSDEGGGKAALLGLSIGAPPGASMGNGKGAGTPDARAGGF